MTKKTDWNELLYHANDGDTITGRRAPGLSGNV